MLNVDKAAVMPDDNDPYHFPDAKKWEDLTQHVAASWRAIKAGGAANAKLDIERKLKTPVSLSFKDVPLNDVLHQLAKLAAINLHLDPKGLAEEGISPDTPVNIDLSQEVSLKSALKLILEPLHLSYVIKDEVLKITSEQLRDNEVYPMIYNVADLVIPIPNFAPNSQHGPDRRLGRRPCQPGRGGQDGNERLQFRRAAGRVGQPRRQRRHRHHQSGHPGPNAADELGHAARRQPGRPWARAAWAAASSPTSIRSPI